MALRIPILFGSMRSARLGIRAVRFFDAALRARGHTTHVVDAMELDLPLLDRMYKEYERGKAPPKLEALAEIYRDADAFLIVSGEYNHNIQPGLKNLLDHFLEEYFFRPSGIVCYSFGQFGGVRAAMALRMTLAELGMSSIPSILPVPRIQDVFTPEGEPTDRNYPRRCERFFREFEWYAEALKAKRAAGVPY